MDAFVAEWLNLYLVIAEFLAEFLAEWVGGCWVPEAVSRTSFQSGIKVIIIKSPQEGAAL